MSLRIRTSSCRRWLPALLLSFVACAPSLLLPGVACAQPVAATPRSTNGATPYLQRTEVKAFAAEVAAEHGIALAEVERWLAAARFQPRIVELMDRPLADPPKWFTYAPNFLAPARVAAGVHWWEANEDALARAYERYGVPPEIIVAIVGVETYYGRYTGSHRALDALVTLAFDYPRRAEFFRGELKAFFALSRQQAFSPLVPKGSYAGALGVPQFMPGSYRRYAVDFDGDGRADLWQSSADAIGSVANYLARHDWIRDQPVLLPALIEEDGREAAWQRLDRGLSERRDLAAWKEDGIAPDTAAVLLAPEPVGLLWLEPAPDGAVEHGGLWVALPNFYVITRYNRSRLYAAAVWALAQAVREEKDTR